MSNLQNRATYLEGGKTYEGCVGGNAQLGILVFYFEDRTVFAVPVQFFSRVSGA